MSIGTISTEAELVRFIEDQLGNTLQVQQQLVGKVAVLEGSAGTVKAARVTRSGTPQAILEDEITYLEFNSEEYDTDGLMHDPVIDNSRLTAPVAGLYAVTATVAWAAAANGERVYLDLVLNRTHVIDVDEPAPDVPHTRSTTRRMATQVELDVDDYVELRALQTQSTGTASREIVVAARYTPFFEMTYLGAVA